MYNLQSTTYSIGMVTKQKFVGAPKTDGSRSTKTALGTCFPELVSEKKVLKESSA